MSLPTPVYGGWRERRGFGLAGLTGRQTFAALGLVGCLLVTALIHPSVLVLLGPVLLVVAPVLLGRVRGESVPSVVSRHVAWLVNERRGRHRSLGHSSAHLPGSLAHLQLVEADDGGDAAMAVVWDPVVRSATALVRLEPTGLEFVDDDEATDRVRGWGDWLARLGYVQDLRHVVVTVASGPTRRTAEPADERSGGLAGLVAAQVADSLQEAASTTTVLSVTMHCPRGLEQGCAELLDLIGAADSLGRCGIGVRRPMSLSDVSVWVRDCFDPQAAGVAMPAVWADARPTAVHERWDRYIHDGVTSVGFFWDECPGQAIDPRALARLLGPSSYRKRISLVYEPVPAHRAAREVDWQAQAAVFRRQYRHRLGRDETAREQADLERARQTAREQAAGAGLIDVGLYAVIGVGVDEDLEACAADVVNRAGESRLRLRRSYGTQELTFAATLGLGLVPRGRW